MDNKFYKVTSICKEDMLNIGFNKEDIENLSEEEMKTIASRMADSYCENSYWIDLKIITEQIINEKE